MRLPRSSLFLFPKRIVDTTIGSGEGEFRMYHRILNFEAMTQVKKKKNEEVYQYYDIEQEGVTRYLVMSQKQMLLLAIYYMYETMYLVVKKTFGTMHYPPAVRVLMYQEHVMAPDLSLWVDHVRFYDLPVSRGQSDIEYHRK